MADLEKADARIQLICEKIRAETLDPAKEQAQEIIDQAKREAERIMQKAHAEAEQHLRQTKKSLEEERQIFNSALQQACKQTIELLKQKIEQSLFNPALQQWVVEQLGDNNNYAKLIDVVVKAIEKEGLQTDLSVKIPEKLDVSEINARLSQEIVNILKNRSVELSDIPGGIQVKLPGKNMVLDLSSTALEEIVSSFVRKDFRKLFFGI